MEPQVGSMIEGKVTTITKFGAFVALEGGRSGLVHISEIANTFVGDVHDFLEEGQTVKVLVLSTENGKINLSIKRRCRLRSALPAGPGLTGRAASASAMDPAPADRATAADPVPAPRAAATAQRRPGRSRAPRPSPEIRPLRISSSSSSPLLRARWRT